MARHVIIIGPFPPPRHGVSTVNESIFRAVQRCDSGSLLINTAPVSLSRSLLVRVWRSARVVRAAVALWKASHQSSNAVVYCSLSGGPGLIWESLFVAIARVNGSRIVVHHHSYRYIDRKYWAMCILSRIAGPNAYHVVLARKMSIGLQQLYPGIRCVLSVSNAWLLSAETTQFESRSRILRVGFLANLSKEKGVFDVVELAKACACAALDIQFIIAGPFENSDTRKAVLQCTSAVPNIQIIGPVYGADKDQFLAGVDAFVFPTRYRNEAEPIVVLEALQHGCPVVAFGRGCIPEMLLNGAGVVVPLTESFVGATLTVLASWSKSPVDFDRARVAAAAQFRELKQRSGFELRELLALMVNPSGRSENMPAV